MICMNADGTCARAGATSGEGELVEHAMGDTVLRMRARRVVVDADLDSVDLLHTSLPMPFGKYIVFAPVVWSASEALTVPKLHDLLERLRSTHRANATRAVVLGEDQFEQEEQDALYDEEDEEDEIQADDVEEDDVEEDDEEDDEDEEVVAGLDE